jgi:hypothetical protein
VGETGRGEGVYYWWCCVLEGGKTDVRGGKGGGSVNQTMLIWMHSSSRS